MISFSSTQAVKKFQDADLGQEEAWKNPIRALYSFAGAGNFMEGLLQSQMKITLDV